jgi:hypothetical protein
MITAVTIFCRKYILFLFMAIGLPIALNAQKSSNCLSLEKLAKLHASTFIEINSTLFKEDWDIVANTNQASFFFGNDIFPAIFGK